MPARTLVVANPRSGAGAAARRLRSIETQLRDALGPLEIEWTRGPRDAERIAREGVRAGVERIVVAGGDGTTGEVTHGLLTAGLSAYCQVGLLPLGTGGDFVRSLGVPRDLETVVADLSAGRSRVIDAGRVRLARRDGGDPATFHFLNSSSTGISGLTAELVNRAPKWLGGRLSFLLGTLRAIAGYGFPPVRVRVDGNVVHEGRLALATACNGCFFGGGMRVAPGARLDDGLLDAIVIPGFSRSRLTSRMPRLYRGTHVNEPGVLHERGRCIEIDALTGDAVFVELDGEPLGILPARFEVVPGALTLFGIPA